jgi:hypothetical protein
MAWTLPDACVLGIFGARPAPGVGDGLPEAMLFDVLDLWDSPGVIAPGGRKVLAYAPGDDETGVWFDTRVPQGFALQPQQGGDIGRRLTAFLDGELEDGAARVVAIGATAPTLDPAFVVSAFVALEGRDLVLGPATSGGLYLVGCRRGLAPVLDEIDWGSPDVLSQTINRLDGTGLSVAVLPPWYMVETGAGARMLRGHLRAMRRAGMDPMLPRTEQWLERAGP